MSTKNVITLYDSKDFDMSKKSYKKTRTIANILAGIYGVQSIEGLKPYEELDGYPEFVLIGKNKKDYICNFGFYDIFKLCNACNCTDFSFPLSSYLASSDNIRIKIELRKDQIWIVLQSKKFYLSQEAKTLGLSIGKCFSCENTKISIRLGVRRNYSYYDKQGVKQYTTHIATIFNPILIKDENYGKYYDRAALKLERCVYTKL